LSHGSKSGRGKLFNAGPVVFQVASPNTNPRNSTPDEQSLLHQMHEACGASPIKDTWISRLTCPFCNGGAKREKNFAIQVTDRHVCYKCFRYNKCGITGRLRLSGESQRQVAPWKSQAAPKEFEPCDPVELDSEVKDFLVEKRGIAPNVLERNRVCQTYLARGSKSAVFRYFVGYKLLAEKYRAINKKILWNARGGASVLYGVDDIMGQKRIILVEGEIDKLSVETAGISEVASLQNGASSVVALTFGAGAALNNAERIVLGFDHDNAGNKAALAAAHQFGWEKCLRVNWRDGCSDANDVLLKHGVDAVREDIDNAKPMYPESKFIHDSRFLLDAALEILDGNCPHEDIYGFSTGWSGMDKLCHIVAGEVSVITGEPGSGKSEWLFSLLFNLMLNHNHRFLVCDFETHERSRQIMLMEKFWKQDLLSCRPEQVDAAYERLDNHFFFWMNSHSFPTVDELLEEAALLAAGPHGLQGLVVDPVNYMAKSEIEERYSDTKYISSLLSRFKQFAMRHKCHVWIVAHPVKKHDLSWMDRPSLYDIMGSANWYNMCDVGIVVQRNKQNRNVITLHVDKVRNSETGRTGAVQLEFDCRTRAFSTIGIESL